MPLYKIRTSRKANHPSSSNVTFVVFQSPQLPECQKNPRAESKEVMTSPCLSWTKLKVRKLQRAFLQWIFIKSSSKWEKCPLALGTKKLSNTLRFFSCHGQRHKHSQSQTTFFLNTAPNQWCAAKVISAQTRLISLNSLSWRQDRLMHHQSHLISEGHPLSHVKSDL